jgi:hypothetical protein
LKKEEIENLKTYNGQISHSFSVEYSWIDWRDPARLRFVNTLFDLNEWQVREIRKRLHENKALVWDGQYQSVIESSRIEFDKIRDEYGTDTDSGKNPLDQTKWENRIQERSPLSHSLQVHSKMSRGET